MRNDFIKLEDLDGSTIYLNAGMIVAIELLISKGSKIQLLMNNKTFKVKQTPDEIMKLIESSKMLCLGKY